MSYSLALGPFHAAWRGPQRIVLRLDGERIADIEYRDGYNERGCAERLARLDLPQALHLVTRICGTCSIAHALAFCQAIESLCGITVGARAAYLRSATAELERVGSHLYAAATVLQTLGLDARALELGRLREAALRQLKTLAGARVGPDVCVPGGVRRNVADADREEALVGLPKLNRAVYRFVDDLIDRRSVLARTVDVGTLPKSAAEQFGVRGPMARACGIAHDVRIDHPYAAYSALPVRMITQEGGDLYARLILLLLEALESIKLVEHALQQLPEGECQGELPEELPRGQASGIVEAPRGLLRYTIDAAEGRLGRVRIDAPRQLDRLLTRTMLSGALLDNAVPIIASCDCCTACAER